MSEPVFCPVCVEEGLRSTVEFSFGVVTAMGWQPWYDEDGQYHNHDPNGHSRNGGCSNGHFWWESWAARCPAGDYGGNVERTVEVVCGNCRGTGNVETARSENSISYDRCPDCAGRGHWGPTELVG